MSLIIDRIDELARSLSGEPIDLLINNAGIYTDSHAGTFNNIDYEAWIRAFLVNTMAPLKMAQAFAPNIARRKPENDRDDQQQNGQYRR